MGKQWFHFIADGYEFKIIDRDETGGIFCKFRVMPEAAINKQMVIGTIFTLSNGSRMQVSSCVFTSGMYAVKITGKCVLQSLSGQPLFGIQNFEN